MWKRVSYFGVSCRCPRRRCFVMLGLTYLEKPSLNFLSPDVRSLCHFVGVLSFEILLLTNGRWTALLSSKIWITLIRRLPNSINNRYGLKNRCVGSCICNPFNKTHVISSTPSLGQRHDPLITRDLQAYSSNHLPILLARYHKRR